MHIVAFSMTPLYPNRVMGGAQKQLHTVAVYLAEQGHRVTVLCTRRHPDALHPFHWHERAQVRPVFRFKQPYPEPYAAPVYDIAAAVQTLGAYLADADVFYSHDGGFVFPYVHAHLPTVVSLRSLLFSETLQSAFLFQGDDLILISNYQRDVLLQTVGRFFPDLRERTHVIYNGLDFEQTAPTAPLYMPEADPERHAIVLFPHRPEAAKGIHQALDVAKRLVQQHGIDNLRLLVPRWITSSLSPADRAFYDDLLARVERDGLREHVVFHEWVSQADMPAYYSLGHATLAIGSYVETFGNVPYESLACGTPSVVATVGPARELLPDALIDKVAYGDTARAAEIVARIIKRNERTHPDTLAYMKTHFQRDDMARAYADVILNAANRPPLAYSAPPSLDERTVYTRPAWVHQSEDGRLYHDFRAEYAEPSALNDIARAYADGWLVPQTTAHTFYLSLGSSDNPAENLRAIVQHLRRRTELVAVSSVYASHDDTGGEAVYLNAAAVVRSPLDASAFKDTVLRPIEAALGRVRGAATVTADVDIIMMDDAVTTYAGGRELPDPDLLRRAFVALPLGEIAADVVHPVTGETLAAVAGRFHDAPVHRQPNITLEG